ncbi:MAG: hypothetical protein HY301_02210 [Verrucomicrobia bacterium]|nr:hypothetical protein [Verrucomicrobiota bacterium]
MNGTDRMKSFLPLLTLVALLGCIRVNRTDETLIRAIQKDLAPGWESSETVKTLTGGNVSELSAYYQALVNGDVASMSKRFLNPAHSGSSRQHALFGRGQELIEAEHLMHLEEVVSAGERGVLISFTVLFQKSTRVEPHPAKIVMVHDLWLLTAQGWKVVPEGEWQPVPK